MIGFLAYNYRYFSMPDKCVGEITCHHNNIMRWLLLLCTLTKKEKTVIVNQLSHKSCVGPGSKPRV